MTEYEKHGYKSAEEAIEKQECPEQGMTEYCILDDCTGHWNREVVDGVRDN